MFPTLMRRIGAIVITSALALGAGSIPAQAASDTTSPVERTRVDRVPAPDLDWQPCDLGECATLTVPLDYDEPDGATIEVGVTRVPARDQANRIGSLLLNPGGPGGQGTILPVVMQEVMGDDVLDHFDLVGFDPRGSYLSTNTRCFARQARQERIFGIINSMGFPVTKGEERRFISAERQVAMNCSNYGRNITSAMSTAEVARDMDVLRRALGDEKLSYLGFSYGSYLGQVYANMFPDRVRAIVIDGVLDPVAWAGTNATKDVPVTVRIGSGAAASGALSVLLQQCADAGDLCPLADPEADFARVANGLLDDPLVLEDPDLGEFTITYQSFVSVVLQLLYSDTAVEEVPSIVAYVDELQGGGLSVAARQRATHGVVKALELAAEDEQPYINAEEVFPAVLCSDSLNPRKTRTWQDMAAGQDEQSPYFGRSWLWSSVVCADQMWNADDEDAWRGPFNKVTSETILVVGNEHDPATAYEGAVAAANILPNSRLLSSDNWGHTAYFASPCSKAYIDSYLMDQSLPPAGTWCRDGYQPFTP